MSYLIKFKTPAKTEPVTAEICNLVDDVGANRTCRYPTHTARNRINQRKTERDMDSIGINDL
jgi:hypothetical protein